MKRSLHIKLAATLTVAESRTLLLLSAGNPPEILISFNYLIATHSTLYTNGVCGERVRQALTLFYNFSLTTKFTNKTQFPNQDHKIWLRSVRSFLPSCQIFTRPQNSNMEWTSEKAIISKHSILFAKYLFLITLCAAEETFDKGFGGP